MSTTLLRVSAIELLYVNRYLDLDQHFYEVVCDYYDNIQAINCHLVDWAKYPKEMGEWLTLAKPILDACASKLVEYLKKTIR